MVINVTMFIRHTNPRVEYHFPDTDGNIKLDVTQEEKNLRVKCDGKLAFSEMQVNGADIILFHQGVIYLHR